MHDNSSVYFMFHTHKLMYNGDKSDARFLIIAKLKLKELVEVTRKREDVVRITLATNCGVKMPSCVSRWRLKLC